jgi:hypothetical protein
MHKVRARDARSLVVFTGLCCAIGGCGAGGGTTVVSASPTGPADQPAAASAGATPIDACSLLSADDIATLLQAPVTGQPNGVGTELPGCSWRNPSTYESVSLQIGNPGTVVNGTLAPIEPGLATPGPDGMRFLGSGMVEFPAGGRSNTVQVAVVRMSGDEANGAAVELARKVAPQIPN